MTLTEGAPGAGLWLSRDDGRTWQAFDDLPFSNIQRIAFDPSDESLMYVTDIRRQHLARTGGPRPEMSVTRLILRRLRLPCRHDRFA